MYMYVDRYPYIYRLAHKLDGSLDFTILAGEGATYNVNQRNWISRARSTVVIMTIYNDSMPVHTYGYIRM